MLRDVCLALAILVASSHVVSSQTVFETVTLTVVDRQHGATQRTISFTMANFGKIPYGSSMIGHLRYPSPDADGAGHDCGEVPCNYACSALDEANPPFDWHHTGIPNIVLVDRVPENMRSGVEQCKHVDKAAHAAAAGAAAVIIADTDDQTSIPVAPNDEEYWKIKQGIQIPTGMIPKTDADWLKALLKSTQKDNVYLQLDFKNPVKEGATVRAEVWHDTDDSCGTRCDDIQKLIQQLGEASKQYEAVDDKAALFQPHYVFQKEDGGCRDQVECDEMCINGRYCHLQATSAAHPGLAARFVAENVRRACLWQVVRGHGAVEENKWFTYTSSFQQSCRSADGTFTDTCSMEVFGRMFGSASDTFKEWKACWADIGADKDIAAVEAELDSAAGDSSTAHIILNPTIRINGQQYRGNMDKDAVMKSICAAHVDGAEPEACRNLGVAECAPGGVGDLECSSDYNVATKRTRCTETFMSYKCECDPGYVGYNLATGPTCVDVNECKTSDPCAGQGPRTVCHNLPGSYRCQSAVKDVCTEENNHGGCWTGKYQGAKVSSCVDNFKAYSAAAIAGWALPPLSRCDCGAVPGCWRNSADGGCEEMCPTSQCLADLHTCEHSTNGSARSTGMIVGIVVSGIALLAVAMAAALYLHRKKMNEHLEDVLGRYVPLDSSPSANPTEFEAYRSPTANSEAINSPGRMSLAQAYSGPPGRSGTDTTADIV